jgi:hypothetical protein
VPVTPPSCRIFTLCRRRRHQHGQQRLRSQGSTISSSSPSLPWEECSNARGGGVASGRAGEGCGGPRDSAHACSSSRIDAGQQVWREGSRRSIRSGKSFGRRRPPFAGQRRSEEGGGSRWGFNGGEIERGLASGEKVGRWRGRSGREERRSGWRCGEGGHAGTGDGGALAAAAAHWMEEEEVGGDARNWHE